MRSIISRVVLLCALLQCWMQAGFTVPVSNQTGIAASNQTLPVKKNVFLASNQTIPVKKNGFLASNQTITVKKNGLLASNQTISVKKNGFVASNQTIPVKKNGFLASNQTVSDKKNRSLAPNQAPTTTARVTTVPTKPTCESVLRNLELHPPPNIKVTVREPVRNYLQAKYRCVKGTYMKNGKTQAMRRCKNGKMIGRSVKCKPIVCGKPNPVPHATFTGTSFTYKSKINYTCDMGYKLKGTKTWRTCKRNGKWTKKPSCIVSKCRISKGLRIRHGTINTTDPEYKDGTTLTFTCNHGYELTGDSTAIECVKGKWSSYRLPICKAIACPDPTKYFSNGRFNGRNFRVNKTVEFICNAGMKLIGSKKRTCQPNKLWSGSLAVCDDGNSYCPNPGVPISGRKIGHRYNLGSIVRFKCDYGYVLVGSAVRQCMQDGKWNGTETVCMAEFQYMVRNSKSNAFMLKKNIDRMLEYTCSGMNTTCNMTAIDMRARAINPKHAGGLDIVFVFDASSSIRKKDFNLSKRFAQELVTVLGASWKPGGTHVAAVTYGTNPHLVFNLGDASALSVENVVKKLGEIIRSGGGTATRAALNMVIKTVVPNTRQQSQKTLFFITDGRSNIGGRPQKAAEHLRDKNNFEIYAVGVGKKVDVMELRSIASEPENDHVLVVENYKQLVENIKKAVHIKIDYSPCGVSPTSFRARMVGGNKAGRGTWPWQVGLYKSGADGNWDIICGGALIDRQWVLTAAHCFYHYNVFSTTRKLQIIPASQYIVKAGDDHLKIKEPAQQDIEASGIYIHNNYRDSPKFENDIALLKLSKKVKLGPFVRTVCLPRKDLVVAGKHGYVAGWGATQVLNHGQDPSNQHKNSKTLQHSAFTIQNNVTCANKTKFFFNPNVTFCAGSGLGGNDTCQGDSGGSFVRQASRGVNEHRWVSVGLVSWGEGCGLRGKYGYYTRVEPYIDWIKKTIQDNNTD